MSLVLDRRSDVGDGPATHVLLVGVSSYPHLGGGSGPTAAETFGLEQLTVGAISAYRVFRYLEERARPVAPLATCRLLVAPGERELAEMPALGALDAGEPTLDGFLRAAAEWRTDTATHRGNVAIAYLAGHGVEVSSAEQLFLLSDFGSGVGPLFRSAVSLHSLYAGMAPQPSQPDVARTQLFAFDASRGHLPSEHHHLALNATQIFDQSPVSLDDRAAAMLFAARAGRVAFGAAGQATFFCSALLQCLDGLGAAPFETAEETRWVVTVSSLAAALGERMRQYGEEFGLDMDVDVGGAVRDVPLFHLAEPPKAKFMIKCAPGATHTLVDDTDKVAWQAEAPADGGTLDVELPAGLYRLDVGDRRGRWRLASPGNSNWDAAAIPERRVHGD